MRDKKFIDAVGLHEALRDPAGFVADMEETRWTVTQHPRVLAARVALRSCTDHEQAAVLKEFLPTVYRTLLADALRRSPNLLPFPEEADGET